MSICSLQHREQLITSWDPSEPYQRQAAQKGYVVSPQLLSRKVAIDVAIPREKPFQLDSLGPQVSRHPYCRHPVGFS